ncbi:hypothetical protein HN858_02275 [Candidatus Falkowbacteria bacterium]|jgi:hypothetical protein|nr:hypothetical protein [Candidatus Falkowbacteria bacterium]MBT5503182.1 hypothetical protein [Candidatus Falkowbacteria bacterium]MBT6574570.1 hypothetical protein [Candidatus Falkowbacteria bacterium]MBT7348482.1 hypothetical protein [Candidatus Falkowbacteria bacterium]MBT7500853.1 hypothetical protein [Candidatus Falkowbacteria bacterium]
MIEIQIEERPSPELKIAFVQKLDNGNTVLKVLLLSEHLDILFEKILELKPGYSFHEYTQEVKRRIEGKSVDDAIKEIRFFNQSSPTVVHHLRKREE